MRFGEATGDQLLDWDRHTVDPPGGNVYQSRPWAEQRSRLGWRPRFLVADDGYRLLALDRHRQPRGFLGAPAGSRHAAGEFRAATGTGEAARCRRWVF